MVKLTKWEVPAEDKGAAAESIILSPSNGLHSQDGMTQAALHKSPALSNKKVPRTSHKNNMYIHF